VKFLILFSLFSIFLNASSKVECPIAEEGLAIFVPHQNDCTKFYMCQGDIPILMSCPDGLYFNDKKNICNFPSAVQCKTETD
jgi:hypothetical protein